jgi:catalase
MNTHYHILPVNAPKGAAVDNYQRDGFMSSGSSAAGYPNYYPNSFDGPEPDSRSAEPTLAVSGQAARQPYIHPNDDFVQPGDLYRNVMTEGDRANLIGNIVSHLGNAQKRIQLRQTAIFYMAYPDYGSRVAKGLGLDLKQVESLAKMTQEERVGATK